MLGSRGLRACFGAGPPPGDTCPSPDLAPGPPAGPPAAAAARSSLWLADRDGCSCQRPTTAPPDPLARLLALPSSSSSGGAGTCKDCALPSVLLCAFGCP